MNKLTYKSVEETHDIEEFNIVEKMPNLDESQIKHAHAPDQVNWAYRQFARGVGRVWDMPDVGIAMQVSSEKTLRVLNVVNHEFPLLILACIGETLSRLGMNLELDEAIIIPYVDSQSGKETENPSTAPEESFIEVV